MKAGWQTRTFREVLEIRNGRNQREVESAHGEFPIYGSAGNVMGMATDYICEAGTTIIGRKGNINSPIYSETRFWNVDTAFGLTAKACLDSRFLYYFCLLYDFGALNRGTTIPSLVKSELLNISIPLPPLPEQQRIVAILDEAFAGIATARANAEQNRQNARTLFESHLQSVFSLRGDGWVEKTLDEAVDNRCSLSYGIVQPGEDQPDGLPIVRPTDLGIKTIELDGLKRIDPSLADSYRRTTLRGGDLLLCVRGSTGVISIASDALAGGNVTRGIVPIHFDDTLVNQNFGYYLMRSEPVQQQIREKTYGAALMQINIRDLRNLILPIPPRAAQAELADRFESMLEETRRLEALYQRKLEALVELKLSLLHQAFSGAL